MLPSDLVSDLSLRVNKKKRPAFPGLRLKRDDRKEIARIRREQVLSDRRWRRLRTLLMFDEGRSIVSIGRALATYPREVRRVGWRYLEGGLEHALCEDHRYTPQRLLDDRQKAQIVALACTDPPEGRARWTVALLTTESIRRRIVRTISRETIRRVLTEHDLKPWREKNVVCPEARPGVRRANGRHPRSARKTN